MEFVVIFLPFQFLSWCKLVYGYLYLQLFLIAKLYFLLQAKHR